MLHATRLLDQVCERIRYKKYNLSQKEGADIRQAQKLLRRSEVSTTMIYTHVLKVVAEEPLAQVFLGVELCHLAETVLRIYLDGG